MIKQDKISKLQRKSRFLLLVVYKAIENFPIEENKDLKTMLRDSATTILWSNHAIFSKKMDPSKEKYFDLLLDQLDKLKRNIRRLYQSGLIEDNWLTVIEKEIKEVNKAYLSIRETFKKEKTGDCHSSESKAEKEYHAQKRDKGFRTNPKRTKHGLCFH